jgi:dephospho-CoA kinase
MEIIGITGTNGAGKGTVVEYLVKNKGFLHFSARAFLMELLKKEGVEINRESLIEKGNELRSKYGPSALVDLLYEEAKKTDQNCIIESIRTVGEIESLRSKGNFVLLAVDADPKIRYERVVLRGSQTDKISFEEFVEQEKMEMKNEDVNKQNVAECIKRADIVLRNDSSREILEKEIERYLVI